MVLQSIINEIINGDISSVTFEVTKNDDVIQSGAFDVFDHDKKVIIRKSADNDIEKSPEASALVISNMITMDIETVAIPVRGENRCLEIPVNKLSFSDGLAEALV